MKWGTYSAEENFDGHTFIGAIDSGHPIMTSIPLYRTEEDGIVYHEMLIVGYQGGVGKPTTLYYMNPESGSILHKGIEYFSANAVNVFIITGCH